MVEKSQYCVGDPRVNCPGTKNIIASPSSSLIRAVIVSPLVPKVSAET